MIKEMIMMSDKLIRVDRERGKAVVLRTFTNSDGSTCEKEIEIDVPKMPTKEGVIRKVKRGADGKMYDVEEIIKIPIADLKKNND
jgi:hypothetical protein